MSRDRDKILEQALKHELRGTAGPPTPGCLDAEMLAAWEDGALDAAQMQAAELHLSNCVRCQSLAGAMARAIPAAAAVEEPNRFRLWSWWLAPIAATAAAVTLWMVVPQQQQQMATAPARDAVVQPSARADSSVTAEPQQLGKLEANQAAPRARAKAQAPVPPAAPIAERDDRHERQAAGADTLAAAPRAAPEPAAPAPAATAMLQKNSARLAFNQVEIVSPDSPRRWRLVPTGVEFSTDQGATWIPVRAVPSETLTHGVSPSGTICWLIGKDGAVLVTADGSSFAKVDLPVRVDLTSITAIDARSATVTTADGRTFRTDDSGRNWRQN